MPSSKKTKVSTLPGLEDLIIKTTLSHQNYTVDIRTWALLYKNNSISEIPELPDETLYKSISNENKWVLPIRGPLFLGERNNQRIIYNISTLIFNPSRKLREIIYNHFSQMKVGIEIGHPTLEGVGALKKNYLD